MAKKIKSTIKVMESVRLNNTVNGNPRYKIIGIVNGIGECELISVSDSSWCYGVNGAWHRTDCNDSKAKIVYCEYHYTKAGKLMLDMLGKPGTREIYNAFGLD